MRVRTRDLVSVYANDQPITTLAGELQQTDVPWVQHVKPAGNEHRSHMLFDTLSTLMRWQRAAKQTDREDSASNGGEI